MALTVKQPWCELILSGKKSWEIRGYPTRFRCFVHIAQSGTGLLVGKARIANCKRLRREDLPKHEREHCITGGNCELVSKYKKIYAWVLKEARRYSVGMPYSRPQGAIAWVRLPTSCPVPADVNEHSKEVGSAPQQ